MSFLHECCKGKFVGDGWTGDMGTYLNIPGLLEQMWLLTECLMYVQCNRKRCIFKQGTVCD